MRATESTAFPPATRLPRHVIVGHRGAPAYRPEHTEASYDLAIDLGADLIEPDIVVSSDGALVVRHENELSLSTDVADRPEFAARRRTGVLDGEPCTGWFTEDFTLAELRTLRAVERLPGLRPLNTTYDGRFGLMTLDEVIALARRRSTATRTVRVLAEIKLPTSSRAHGVPVTDLVADELRRLDATGPDGTVVLQSFDPAGLRELRAALGDEGPTMIQLVENCREHDPMLTPAGLREISTYAQAVGPGHHRILLRDTDDTMTGISGLVGQAHAAGLAVIPWTLRPENAFLPRHLRRGSDPGTHGDAIGEARLLLEAGVDGLITDAPDIASSARSGLAARVPAPV